MIRRTPMAWMLISVVVLCIAGTVVVGMGLYAVTEQHPQFNTR